MRRRDFIALFVGAAAASVLRARTASTQPGKPWRIGFIVGGTTLLLSDGGTAINGQCLVFHMPLTSMT